MQQENKQLTSFAYSARIAGTEPEETSYPTSAPTQVYVLTRQGSQWKWTPGIQLTMRNGAYRDRVEVTVKIGDGDAFTHPFERELVKVSLGSYIPTRVELEVLMEVIKRKQKQWLDVANTGTPSQFVLDAIERSTKNHEQTIADLRIQIAMTEV
jgi:hypothetical protein